MLIGQNWKDYFDVVIVQARKPRFFTDDSRPFRVFDTKTGTHLWDRVSKLDREKTYFEGTVKQLQELKGWSGHEVLYFGDHPYSDLADVTLEHGWRTGAIISELDVCVTHIFVEYSEMKFPNFRFIYSMKSIRLTIRNSKPMQIGFKC